MYVGIYLEFYVTVTCTARGGSFQSVWESLVSCMDHKTLKRDFIFCSLVFRKVISLNQRQLSKLCGL